MEQGICRPSKSPLQMVKKSNGKWRLYDDYRRVTLPDRYPIPYLQDVMQRLCNKKIFSKIDLIKPYNQIPVEPTDIPKTAITTPFGLYEFILMPYGLIKNAAQAFQRFIHGVIKDLDFCEAYLDDILILSTSEKEHMKHFKILFKTLNDNGVVINSNKCVFGQK